MQHTLTYQRKKRQQKEKADAEAKKKNTGDALITQGLSNGVPTGFDINNDMTAGGVAGGGLPPTPAGTFNF